MYQQEKKGHFEFDISETSEKSEEQTSGLQEGTLSRSDTLCRSVPGSGLVLLPHQRRSTENKRDGPSSLTPLSQLFLWGLYTCFLHCCLGAKYS